eukprot:GHVT01029795.1.p1 GENE.GHVT01029795.1~~GHVT01029795.1.p1  ORF type:complete len:252 (-),score=54.31 GHVT01029795.1:339-1094(-)
MHGPSSFPGTSSSKKVLLMGRAGAGKTSMRSIVFANYLARDTRRLTATNRIEHSHLRFLGNLVLSLWDCGGQDTFMENYFDSQREHIFRNAEVLIYVLEVRSSTLNMLTSHTRHNEVEKDFLYLKQTLTTIDAYAPSARVFCLVHKMDLVREEERPQMMAYYAQEIDKINPGGLSLTTFGTSIWDESLFKAWSEIVYTLIPNVQLLEEQLSFFGEICEADEVVLFEKSTFLVITHATRKPHHDHHRARFPA